METHTLVKPATLNLKYMSGETRSTEPMETQILERAILKIGGLLAIGLGEAGANIVATNMRGHEDGMLIL
jgi:hypothetical protein